MDSFRPQKKKELFWEPGLGFDLVGIIGRALISRKSRTKNLGKREALFSSQREGLSAHSGRETSSSVQGEERKKATPTLGLELVGF